MIGLDLAKNVSQIHGMSVIGSSAADFLTKVGAP